MSTLVPKQEGDVGKMRAHYQRRLFYAGTIGLVIMYVGAIILLILSFGGRAIRAEYQNSNAPASSTAGAGPISPACLDGAGSRVLVKGTNCSASSRNYPNDDGAR
jgi:hypothetical protein